MARSAGERVRLPYWPALDGLRGLAVLAVLFFHAGFGWARGGYLGVSAFFTLSGFLITTLLVTEWRETGSISLKRFWARRLRRLMPVALLALGGIVVFGALAADADQLRELRPDVLAALGYVANWRFVFSGQSYAQLFRAPSPVLHFWSLAIEEQFYLCFPLLALAALRLRGRRGLAVVLVALGAGSLLASRLLLAGGASADRLYYGTDTRALELLAGALLALVLSRVDAPRRSGSRLVLQAGGVVALAAMVALWLTLAQSDRWLHRGALVLHAGLAAMVLAAAVQPSGPVRALLGRETLRRLGLISYGVYVYHWPVFLWLDAERTGLRTPLALFALRVSVTVGLAVCSYHLLERPIRERRRLRGRLPWALTPAVALALCASLVVVTSDRPPPTIVYSAVYEKVPPPPPPPVRSVATALASTQPPTHPLRIMIVGDSVAETVGRGIERWGMRTGEAVVKNAGVGWCAIGRGGVAYLFGNRPRDQSSCSRWSRWGVDRVRPDVVVVLSTLWETFPRQLRQWDGARRIGDPDYDRWLVSEYAAATEYFSSFGARVIWLTAPCAESLQPDVIAALRHLNAMIKWLPFLTAPGQLKVLDLYDHVCPDGAFTANLGGIEGARPDGIHFSDPGSDWLASWLGPQLVAAFPQPAA